MVGSGWGWQGERVLQSSVKMQGPKNQSKPGDYPPVSSATRPTSSPSPSTEPPLHEARPGFYFATSTKRPPRLCPQGPAVHQSTGTQGLWAWRGLPFHSPAGDTPVRGGIKPQTFRAEPLTPTPRLPLQRLLYSLSSQSKLPRQGHPQASPASCYLPVKDG